MWIDVLVALACVALIAAVLGSRRRNTRVKSAGRTRVLQQLAPVVSGTVSASHELVGKHGGFPVEASLTRTDPSQLGISRSSDLPEVMQLVLWGVSGSSPWRFKVADHIGHTTTWDFVGPEYSMGRLGNALGRRSPVRVDPAIEGRLREGGMIEAIEQLGPPSKAWLPDVSFEPDITPPMVERMQQAGIEPTEQKLDALPKRTGRLRIQLERHDEGDPSPERFRDILDAALGIAELNARINPAPTAV